MVGLSILLESHCQNNGQNTSLPLVVVNKATMTIKSPPSPSSSGSRFHRPPPPESFLDSCLLCRQKILPGKDIYMYKGDRAFCSEECRLNQMLMEEEEEESSLSRRRRRVSDSNKNCSLAAMKPIKSSTGKTPERRSSRSRRGGGGGFEH